MTPEIKKQTIQSMNKLAFRSLLLTVAIDFALAIIIGLIVSTEADDEAIICAVISFFVLLIFFLPLIQAAFKTLKNSFYLKKHDMKCSLVNVLSVTYNPLYFFVLKEKYRPQDIGLYKYKDETYSAHIFGMVKNSNDDGKLVMFVDDLAAEGDVVFAVPTVYVPDLADFIRESETGLNLQENMYGTN